MADGSWRLGSYGTESSRRYAKSRQRQSAHIASTRTNTSTRSRPVIYRLLPAFTRTTVRVSVDSDCQV
eukprot:scaffold83918_cov33-Prasinocladus_malaysianus.AAC.1